MGFFARSATAYSRLMFKFEMNTLGSFVLQLGDVCGSRLDDMWISARWGFPGGRACNPAMLPSSPLKPRGRRWQLVADAICVSMPCHARVLQAGMSNMLRYHIWVRKLTRGFESVVTPLWPWWSLGYMLDHDCHPTLVVWCRHHYRKVPCWCRVYVLFGCSIEAEKNLLIMVFQILQNLSLEIQPKMSQS